MAILREQEKLLHPFVRNVTLGQALDGVGQSSHRKLQRREDGEESEGFGSSQLVAADREREESDDGGDDRDGRGQRRDHGLQHGGPPQLFDLSLSDVQNSLDERLLPGVHLDESDCVDDLVHLGDAAVRDTDDPQAEDRSQAGHTSLK